MAVSMILKLTCVIFACMVVSAPYAEGAISCGFIYGQLSSCLGYLRSGRGLPPPACCKGVSSINSAARSTPDRQAACRCLKTAAGGVNPATAASLPGKCRVSIPYKISPSVNCNSIK